MPDADHADAPYDQIRVERDGPVALVTLNRPEQMNAWTFRMADELGQAFADADADDSVRAIVVTGAGKAFCAGADLSGGAGTFAGTSEVIGAPDMSRRRAHPPEMNTPVIAAINGAAVGAGLTMAVLFDLRVVAADAKLGFVFNRRGMIADADLLWFLPRLIGYGAAMDLLLTGRIFGGDEALDLGLVHRVVPAGPPGPAGNVVRCAMDLAHDIAANTAPASAAITKRLLHEFLAEDRESATARQNRMFAWAGSQPDAAEGVMAFLQHRQPHWTMSKRVDLNDPN